MITLYLQPCPRFDGFDRVYFTKREGKGQGITRSATVFSGNGQVALEEGMDYVLALKGFNWTRISSARVTSVSTEPRKRSEIT